MGHIVRMTNQRQTILEELKKLTSHPSADDLYHIVKKRLPNISLGTIYRNLDILSESGVIQRIEVAGTKKRYDGNPETHYHLRCLSCGAVLDIERGPVVDLDGITRGFAGYRILGYRLELIGLCAACGEEEENREGEAAPVPGSDA